MAVCNKLGDGDYYKVNIHREETHTEAFDGMSETILSKWTTTLERSYKLGF